MRSRIALLTLIAASISVTAVAQDVVSSEGKSDEKKMISSRPSRDFVIFDLMFNGWQNTPDSIKTTGIGRGANFYVCYDFPLGKKQETHFSFAAGVGISVSNIYLKDQEIVLNEFTDSIPQAQFIKETRDYKRYKLTTAYLEAPFELRFFGNKYNRNKGFKAAVGMRVGTLVSAGTKGRENGSKINYQVKTRNYLENWRFSTSIRLGWGNFGLTGTYNLTNLYKDLQGPAITPYAIGISLTGL